MERIVKTLIVLSLGLFIPAFADTQQAVQSPQQTQVQKTELMKCVRTFELPYDKLFYLTLAGLNEYNYKINSDKKRIHYF